MYCPYYRPNEETKERIAKEVMGVIEKRGIEEFTKKFCESHKEEEHIIPPYEICGMNEEMYKEFNEAQKEFRINFFLRNMKGMEPENIAMSIAFHYGGDIRKEVYEKIVE